MPKGHIELVQRGFSLLKTLGYPLSRIKTDHHTSDIVIDLVALGTDNKPEIAVICGTIDPVSLLSLKSRFNTIILLPYTRK